MYKSIFTLLMVLAFGSLTFAQNGMRTNVSTFDVVPLKPNGHYNGSDQKGGFWNGHFYYRNSYDTAWKSWLGIAVSNNTDTVTNSFTNEYSSITGGGINGTKNYAVCYLGGTIKCEKATKLTGFYVTNTTYTYKTIKAGSAFSKKFGGASGNDKDWYRLKIMSYSGGIKADSLRFYLADYQDDNNARDYILKDWTWVDMANFKISDSLVLSFESSDMGQFGMNTPAYVAIDDVNFTSPNKYTWDVDFNNQIFFNKDKIWNGEQDTSGGFMNGLFYFENHFDTKYKVWNGWALSKQADTTKKGFEAQYTNVTGSDSDKDSAYAISYGKSIIRLPYKWIPQGGGYLRFYITNNSFTYKDMKYGSPFSKKFGGASGLDSDSLKLIIRGYDTKNQIQMEQNIFLADFRNGKKMILDKWVAFENGLTGLNRLNGIQRYEFQLESSDNGQFGMNTPAYFCLDNFIVEFESIEKISRQKISIYPNPSSTYITADIQNPEIFEIIDMTGRQFMLNENPTSNVIDISQLPKGIYCLKMKANEMVYSAKFVKL